MKIIAITALALAAALLTACSESPAQGCLITHVNSVKLNPAVSFPTNAEPVAMNPGDSYQIWCAREIRDFTVGDIISEDQQVLKIASLPADIELEIRPNERDSVYLGHPISSSANVWKGFEEASASMTPADWRGGVAALVFIAIVLAVAVAMYFWRRNGQKVGAVSVERF